MADFDFNRLGRESRAVLAVVVDVLREGPRSQGAVVRSAVAATGCLPQTCLALLLNARKFGLLAKLAQPTRVCLTDLGRQWLDSAEGQSYFNDSGTP